MSRHWQTTETTSNEFLPGIKLSRPRQNISGSTHNTKLHFFLEFKCHREWGVSFSYCELSSITHKPQPTLERVQRPTLPGAAIPYLSVKVLMGMAWFRDSLHFWNRDVRNVLTTLSSDKFRASEGTVSLLSNSNSSHIRLINFFRYVSTPLLLRLHITITSFYYYNTEHLFS